MFHCLELCFLLFVVKAKVVISIDEATCLKSTPFKGLNVTLQKRTTLFSRLPFLAASSPSNALEEGMSLFFPYHFTY
jgi:hypothetical protein